MTLQTDDLTLLRIKTANLVEALAAHKIAVDTRQPEMENSFLYRLGCPYLAEYGAIQWPDLRPHHAVVARECVVELLAAFVGARKEMQESASDAASVLAGLIAHQWWESCLDSLPGAYTLAAAVLNYVELYGPSVELDRATSPVVCEMLNAWLKPSKPWSELPLAGVIAEHMFGELWSSLALPDSCFDSDADYVETRILASLIVLRDRPPFLHGLCRARDAAFGVNLPDLDNRP